MLTSKDLLQKALDYDMFWNGSKKMRDSIPAKARKSQIDALLKGFGISRKNARSLSQVPSEGKANMTCETIYGNNRRKKSMGRLDHIKTLTDVEYLSSGEFLADRERSIYQSIIDQITASNKSFFPEQAVVLEGRAGIVNLVRLFANLYRFRLSIRQLHHYPFTEKPSKESSPDDNYSRYLKEPFINSLETNLTEIDNLLCFFIDPEKRTLLEDEIEYPYFDLDNLDADWVKQLHVK